MAKKKKAKKKKTAEIFGPFIDRYTIQQAQADGAVVPIFYEGRTSDGAVAGGGRLDHCHIDRGSAQERRKTRTQHTNAGCSHPHLSVPHGVRCEPQGVGVKHHLKR